MKHKKKIIQAVKILIVIYCGIGITLYYLQEFLLFHPVKLDRNTHYNFKGKYKEQDVIFNSTDTINLVKFFPDSNIKKAGVVLYFHGNRENIGHYASFADNFTKHGYEVWMEDYPGFGKSTGERSEKKMYEQALQIQKMAAVNFKTDSMIIYGKSFGTGIASYLASVADCRSLILETPYYSVPDLFSCYAPIYPTRAMSTYKLPVNEYLKEVSAPGIIFQGTEDAVIPYRCSGGLKTVLRKKDAFISIKGAGHNNLNDFAQFHHVLDSILH